MSYFVYIMASGPNGTLYIGVTNDLVRRAAEHRTGAVPGFTKRHRVHRLVYFEAHDDIAEAIRRETRLKDWDRDWKKDGTTCSIASRNNCWFWPRRGSRAAPAMTAVGEAAVVLPRCHPAEEATDRFAQSEREARAP